MQELHVEPDYLALVNPDDLVPVHTVRGDTLVAVAARIGEVRLIDNTLINGSGS
jgi:pantoate--beta-alanine ligase